MLYVYNATPCGLFTDLSVSTYKNLARHGAPLSYSFSTLSRPHLIRDIWGFFPLRNFSTAIQRLQSDKIVRNRLSLQSFIKF